MFRHLLTPALVVALLSAAASTVDAALEYDQNVTSNAIFGGGNANGSYTTDRNNNEGVELGLRAKVRFPTSLNEFRSNGDGTYGSFDPGGFGTGGNRASWNFEWSINTDYLGSSGLKLDDLTYEIRIDSDPTAATSFLEFDPIKDPNPATIYWDHSIGNNSTASGAGVEATSVPQYVNLIANNNLAQNSWQLNFFSGLLSPPFDPNENGIYTIQLAAYQASQQVAETSIKVYVGVVPEPGTCLIWAGLAGCIAVAARRRKNKAAA